MTTRYAKATGTIAADSETDAPSDLAASGSVHPEGDGAERLATHRLVAALYDNVAIGLIAQPVAAAVVTAIVLAVMPATLPVVWLAAFIAVIAGRYRLLRAYRMARPPPGAAGRWAARFAAGACLTGIMWGLASLLFLPQIPLVHQLFLIVVLMGAAAAGASTLAPHLPSLYLYLAPTVLPVAAAYLVMLGQAAGTRRDIVLGFVVLAFLFTGVSIAIGRHINRLLRRSLMLDQRTRELIHGLGAARRAAEQASRTKSTFLAHVSHELRTPLNAIIGFSEMLESEVLGPIGDERYRDFAARIHSSSRHLLSLINDILDLTKIEAGKLELHAQEVTLSEAVAEVLPMVGDSAVEAGVELRTELPAALPVLCADARAMHQILLNLLSNAIKFTPPGGQVTVSARIEDDGGLALVVCDTGIGIAPEDMDAVLAPFGQIDSNLARRHRGTGLGLPLTKSLVEGHGGRLEIDSTPGSGTSVIAHFPAERVRRPPDGAAAPD